MVCVRDYLTFFTTHIVQDYIPCIHRLIIHHHKHVATFSIVHSFSRTFQTSQTINHTKYNVPTCPPMYRKRIDGVKSKTAHHGFSSNRFISVPIRPVCATGWGLSEHINAPCTKRLCVRVSFSLQTPLNVAAAHSGRKLIHAFTE